MLLNTLKTFVSSRTPSPHRGAAAIWSMPEQQHFLIPLLRIAGSQGDGVTVQVYVEQITLPSRGASPARDPTTQSLKTVIAQGRSRAPARLVPQASVLAIPMHGLPEVGVVAPEPVGRTKARSHEVCLAIDLTIQKSLTVTAQGRSRVPAKRVPQTFAVPAVYAAVPMV